MLRVKRVSDSIFPLEMVAPGVQNYINEVYEGHKNRFERLCKEYYSEIQKRMKEEVIEHYAPEIETFINNFNLDPYKFAEENGIDYKLSSSEIWKIQSQFKTNFLGKIANEELPLFENKKKEAEIKKIKKIFQLKLNGKKRTYPPKKEKIYHETKDSDDFILEYSNDEEYVLKKYGISNPTEKQLPSKYAFLGRFSRGSFSRITFEEGEKDYYSSLTYFDLNFTEKEKVIRYEPHYNNYSFFLYNGSVYLAEYNEFFTDEELLLKVKEKLYKEDKKFEILKKQIEAYESNVETSDKRQREPIPEEVRFEVWRRDEGKCVQCGSKENLEFDHIIPFSKGGANTARNLQLLCQNCNRKKSDKI